MTVAERGHVKEFMRAQGPVGSMVADAAADVMEAFERSESDTSGQITDRPVHPWDGDDDGHNCKGCPEGNIWRCDKAAHNGTMHPDLREAFRRYSVGPEWTRAEVLRLVQRLTKEKAT